SLLTWYKILENDPDNQIANDYIKKIKKTKSRKLNIAHEDINTINSRPVIFDTQTLIIKQNEIAAYKFFDIGEYDEAIAKLRYILKYYPLNIHARSLLALTLFKMQKVDHSLSEWENILEIDQNNIQAQTYQKILLNSTYNELQKMTDKIELPKDKRFIQSTDKKPGLLFEGLENTLLFDGYFVNGTSEDEHTLNIEKLTTLKMSINDTPIQFVMSNDFWRSHNDEWDQGDYELIYRNRQATLKIFGKELQILAGDISTHYLFSKNPSHFFVYPGVDYRGINVIFNSGKFRSKIMWGFIPYFEARKDIDGAPRVSAFSRIRDNHKSLRFRRDYSYPREITCVDLSYDVNPQYRIGGIFAHTEDHSAIKKISNRMPISDNYVLSFNQSINLFPGKRVSAYSQTPEYEQGDYFQNIAKFFDYLKDNLKWHIYHEFAYSWHFEDQDNSLPIYTPEDKLHENLYLNDWATYVRSEFSLPKYHSQIIYQRINPFFRNLTGFTYANSITYDREYFESKSYFYPTDNLNFSTNISKLNSDLDNDPYISKKDWFSSKFNMRWLPGGWIPDVSMDLVYENYHSPDGSEFTPNDWNIGSYCLGLYKNIFDWDLHGIYKVSVYDDDRNDYNQTYENFFSFEIFKTIFEGVDLSAGHYFKDKDANRQIPAWDFDRDYNHTDVTLNFELWDTATLSFLYSYLIDEDNFNSPTRNKVHAFSTTFGWPIYLTNSKGHEIDIYPYITCITHNSGRSKQDTSIFEPTLNIKYKLDNLNNLNLDSSYRHDSGCEDEFRFYMYLNFGFGIKRVKIDDSETNPNLRKFKQRQRIYTVGINDSLFIEIVNKKNLSTLKELTLTVDQNGIISAPAFGAVNVYDKTLKEVETLISNQLVKPYCAAEINVSSLAYMNDNIVVIGEVKNPGVYSLMNSLTVMEAIAMAGGTDEYRADHSKIVVLRAATNEKITVNLKKYILENDNSQNIRLQSG
ncbi:polysaccharide biosynthesis/export family protein, partial [bacterium]|nr:polysaccharide biosynthesis/export family protein [bacterium]